MIVGLLAALTHARATGQGQVVDAAMCDGAASLMSYFYGFRAEGVHSKLRADNRIDGGAPFYETYKCADGEWIALGSIEPQFYNLLREKAGLSDPAFDAQMDRARWPELKEKIARVISTKSRNEWSAIMEGTDVCFAPVLEMDEAPSYPHNKERDAFVEIAGVVQPAPAPRFDRTPGAVQGPPPEIGAHNQEALRDWGVAASQIADLQRKGII
jgi:alpha-methylacyl-CoA racemase